MAPAIVDSETFDRIQKGLSSRRPAEVHPRVVSSFYPLSGLLRAPCGKAMIGRSAKSRQYYYYACNGGHKEGCSDRSIGVFPKHKLESRVTDVITTRILNEESIEKPAVMVNEKLDATSGSDEEKRQSIEVESRDVSLRLQRLYDALETGKLNWTIQRPDKRDEGKAGSGKRYFRVSANDLSVDLARYSPLSRVKRQPGVPARAEDNTLPVQPRGQERRKTASAEAGIDEMVEAGESRTPRPREAAQDILRA